MNKYILPINYNEKYYWTAKKPVLLNNMLLAEDWNKYIVVDLLKDRVIGLSSVLTSVFNNPIKIDYTLILSTNNFYPSTSILSTVNGRAQNYASGISTIKINDEYLYGSFLCSYLSAGTTLVNTLNGKTGSVTNILTGIEIDGNISSDVEVNLGDFYLLGTSLVSSINNGLVGEQWVITSLAINGRLYNYLQNTDYLINVDENFGANLFKRLQELNNATCNTSLTLSSIVNLLMFGTQYQVSGIISAGTTNTFYNVYEWISITDLNYNLIIPNSVTLVNGTLTVDSPSAGIIYYISKITT